jgi:hypothetical protein
MSLTSQIPPILTLFEGDPPEGLIFDKYETIDIDIYDIVIKKIYNCELTIRIYQYNNPLYIEYLLGSPHHEQVELVHGWPIENNLNSVLSIFYDKYHITKLLRSFNNEIDYIINDNDNNILLFQLLFKIKDNCIEVYKHIQPFPEIYYKRLEYNNLKDSLKIIEFISLSLSEGYEQLMLKLLADPCENQYLMATN